MSDYDDYKCVLAKNGAKKYYYKKKPIKKGDVPKSMLASLLCEQKGKALVSERVKGFDVAEKKAKKPVKKPVKTKTKISKEDTDTDTDTETDVESSGEVSKPKPPLRSPPGKIEKPKPPPRSPSGKKRSSKSPGTAEHGGRRSSKKVPIVRRKYPPSESLDNVIPKLKYDVLYYTWDREGEPMFSGSLPREEADELERTINNDHLESISEKISSHLSNIHYGPLELSKYNKLSINVPIMDVSTSSLNDLLEEISNIFEKGNSVGAWTEKDDDFSVMITLVPYSIKLD